MASLAAAACRLSARTALRAASIRGYHASPLRLAAQNFTMPALSPTMTEGNISAWKVKEGDSFVAGDVLLEIETDKATMDVEAQDDGVVMRIVTGDGAKGVQVGTRIAVVAEPGDDVSKLEMPPDEPSAASQKKESEPGAETKKEEQEEKSKPTRQPSGEKHAQRYPLLPSVQSLVAQHNLDDAAVESIKPTGPNGRLLKGDVLAYLGTINPDTPAQVSARFEKASHLDLSNIKVAAPKKEEAAKKDPAPQPAPPQESSIAVPVSLAKVLEVQHRLEKKLGTALPVSAFIARAADVANDDLPPTVRPSTRNELFDAVLGLETARAPSRGSYIPEIQALPSTPSAPRQRSRQTDIIDILAGTSKKRTAPMPPPASAPGITAGPNIFSLTVPKAEEKRASVFLERMKTILETEPGRLVL